MQKRHADVTCHFVHVFFRQANDLLEQSNRLLEKSLQCLDGTTWKRAPDVADVARIQASLEQLRAELATLIKPK